VPHTAHMDAEALRAALQLFRVMRELEVHSH